MSDETPTFDSLTANVDDPAKVRALYAAASDLVTASRAAGGSGGTRSPNHGNTLDLSGQAALDIPDIKADVERLSRESGIDPNAMMTVIDDALGAGVIVSAHSPRR